MSDQQSALDEDMLNMAGAERKYSAIVVGYACALLDRREKKRKIYASGVVPN